VPFSATNEVVNNSVIVLISILSNTVARIGAVR